MKTLNFQAVEFALTQRPTLSRNLWLVQQEPATRQTGEPGPVIKIEQDNSGILGVCRELSDYDKIATELWQSSSDCLGNVPQDIYAQHPLG
jgi:hypothetical protein